LLAFQVTKGVTLLSTEAEYIAISNAVKELKFIYYLLSDLHIKVNLPIVVKTDGQHWSDFDVQQCFDLLFYSARYHFVREFIEDGFIKIEFFRSVENDSDLFTKNVYQDFYENHTKKFLEEVEGHSTGLTLQRVLEISFAINNLVLHI
jgi:hypothetical protein